MMTWYWWKMLTITCTIAFVDGKTITGTMHAKSARAVYRIEYSGVIDRLPQMPKSATPEAFELLFATAIYDGAVGGSVGAEGQYDFGPQYVPNDRFLEVQRNRHLYPASRAALFPSLKCSWLRDAKSSRLVLSDRTLHPYPPRVVG